MRLVCCASYLLLSSKFDQSLVIHAAAELE
jgi:hypothetical protein